MSYSLAQAAKAVHRNKTTLLRAIQSGKLSAVRDAATGAWLVDPAELHRVYPADTDAAVSAAPEAATRSGDAEGEIRELRARLADKDDQISDLRRRLDTATQQLGEALSQVRLLTDQRVAPPAAPARRTWWPWRRR